MTMPINKSKTFLSVPQLSQRHPAFSISAIRHLIFDAKTNGFHRVLHRIGKKLVLEESAFEQWILDQQKEGDKA